MTPRSLAPVSLFFVCSLACLMAFTYGASPVLGAQGDCSQPATSGAAPAASDCLFILRVAVGTQVCSPECICAPRGTLPVTATDALVCLKKAVGQPVTLDCPCGSSTTSTTVTTTTVPGGTSTTVTTTLPSSTSTTATSSTLPATTTTTTTTTTVPFFECNVRFRMTSAATIGSLSFEANYQLIYGLFVGDGDTVQCTPLASAVFDFSNDYGFKILTIGVTSKSGLAGPVDLADCVYSTNDPGFAPEDVRILNVSASSPVFDPVDATVEVSSVSCP